MNAPTSEGTKRCYICGETKPLINFHRDKSRHSGRGSSCTPCHRQKTKEWHSRNPDAKWESALRINYKMSSDDYEALMAQQRGVCAICGEPCGSYRRLAVDHDHTTGTVRGLLCMHCNQGLGKFRDSPERLRCAAVYLETPRLAILGDT